ncbi:MAG: NAD(P)-dependent oxidoreductase [Candidatus Methylomirabilales bacterium]
MARIVVPDDSPPVLTGTAAIERIRSAGDTVVFNTPPASEDDLIRRIDGAHTVVNIRGYCKFPLRVLEAVDGTLRHLAVWGTGTDNIDLAAARRLGIVVSNTPGTATDALAEHTLALLLAVARRLVSLDAGVREGGWERGMLFQCCGKTLGIIGTGAIGSRVAELGRSIGMRVIAWTLHPDAEKARRRGFAYVSTLDDLLEQADVVSLHLRSSPATRGIIGPGQFARMKTGAIFLNTARGDLVDEDALVAALRSGQLLGAGLDVFSTEPVQADNPLKGLPNVVLTPHTGGTTPEALEAGLNLCADNVVSYLTRGEVSHRVV